jgi:putative FmdB family regulatory protein
MSSEAWGCSSNMPSYDLKCEDCGRSFEVFIQGFLKEQHKVCPECGSRRVDQLFTGFLVGTGSGSGSTPSSGGCGTHGGFG